MIPCAVNPCANEDWGETIQVIVFGENCEFAMDTVVGLAFVGF